MTAGRKRYISGEDFICPMAILSWPTVLKAQVKIQIYCLPKQRRVEGKQQLRSGKREDIVSNAALEHCTCHNVSNAHSAVFTTMYQMHALKRCSCHSVSNASSEWGGTHHRMAR